MNSYLADVLPFESFHVAASSVLKHLHQQLGFSLWMVTRTEGSDWVVLEAEDQGYGVSRGDVFTWTDSFCSRMVEDMGPRIAPRSDEIPAYATAPIGRQVRIQAYVGVPLTWEDGRLFGTLCAIDPQPRPEEIRARLPEVELFARVLSCILNAELKAAEMARDAERARLDSMLDPLTGMYNRRGWERLLAVEEARCHRYGHPACLMSIDLDGLKTVNDTQGHASGDELIRRAAHAVKSVLRQQDLAARLGGDEFAVLAVECDCSGAETLRARLEQALAEHEVTASIGTAMARPNAAFSVTWEAADRTMYDVKRSRSSQRRLHASLLQRAWNSDKEGRFAGTASH
ncbi:MAG: GGDEF domain-containing protein [Planctomycetota bacterium]|jgi:diguanylate cyclase (GGDEF)-like protein